MKINSNFKILLSYLLPFKSGLILPLKREKRRLFNLPLPIYCSAGFATSYCGHFELLDLVEYKFFVFCAKTIRISTYGFDAVVVSTLDLDFLFQSCSAYCGS